MTDPSDESLMHAAQGGSRGALDTLFQRYHRQLYGFLTRLTNDRTAAEDLVQEVFLKLIRFRGQFDPARPFTAWLYRIARNTAYDNFPRRSPADASNILSDTCSPDEIAGTTSDALDAIVAGEDHERLERALAALPIHHRDVLLLRAHAELTHQELGETLGCTTGAARVRLHRALQALRIQWHKEDL